MQKKLLPPHVSRPRAHRWPYRAELAFARSVPSLIMTEEHRGSQQRPAITVVMRGVVRAAARTQRKRGKAMRSMMIAAVGIVCIFAGGCASHNLLTKADASWGRSGLFQAARAERLEQAMTDKDIAALLDVAIEAKLPTAIALAKLTGGEWGKPHLATIGGDLVDRSDDHHAERSGELAHSGHRRAVDSRLGESAPQVTLLEPKVRPSK